MYTILQAVTPEISDQGTAILENSTWSVPLRRIFGSALEPERCLWGQVLDLSACETWCALISQELAGKPLLPEDKKNISGQLPKPLKLASEAFISGLAIKSRTGPLSRRTRPLRQEVL